MIDIEKEATNYLRVQTTYYKKSQPPMSSGDLEATLNPWKFSTIQQDFPKDWKSLVAKIPKYTSFCSIPEHLNYKRDVNGWYNRYEPLPHKSSPGSFLHIRQFLEHIFRDQLELGLDYLTILYKHPYQSLPILCLISRENNTGKSTFLKLLKNIFGHNMTFNSMSDIRSTFNSDWASKLIIGIEESFDSNRKEDSEKIKNLSTAMTFKLEAKGQDRFEIEFFGKIILCSNNERNFIFMDQAEIRYWVRKIPTIPKHRLDPDLLNKMIKEIPGFLFYLRSREISVPRKTRMWFTEEQIMTPELKKIKAHYLNPVEKEIYETLSEIMDNTGIDEFFFTNGNLKTLMERNKVKVSKGELTHIIKNKWKLQPVPNASGYTTYLYDRNGILSEYQLKGRYYSIRKWELERIYVDLLL